MIKSVGAMIRLLKLALSCPTFSPPLILPATASIELSRSLKIRYRTEIFLWDLGIRILDKLSETVFLPIPFVLLARKEKKNTWEEF